MKQPTASTSDVLWSWLKTWIPRLLPVIAAAGLLITMAVAAAWFFRHDLKAIQFPYALDYGEGPLLDQTMRLSRLENIYKRDLSQPPYTISNYPPLFLLMQVPFAWLFGPAFWYGRVLNVISIVAAAISIILIIHALTQGWLAGVVGGLTLFLFPYIVHWSAFNRIDCLALGLSCAALYVIVKWGERRVGLIGGAVLLTAAVYTRQSYALAAPLAAFVWLLRDDDPPPLRRRAFELAAWVAGMSLGLFALITLATRGGFYFHIVTSNVNPFYWDTVQRYIDELVGQVPWLLVASMALLLGGALMGRRLRPRSWWLVAPYLVGAALSAVTIGKSGSNVNYLFELCAALSLMVGAWVAWLGKPWRWSTPRSLPWLQALILLALIPGVMSMARWTTGGRYQWIMGKINAVQEIKKMVRIVQEADGPVLADEYMGLIPLAGKPLYYQPFEFKQLILAGLWDQDRLIEAIEKQEFTAILLYEPTTWNSRKERWTDAELTFIELYYQRGEKLAETVVYRPRTGELGW